MPTPPSSSTFPHPKYVLTTPAPMKLLYPPDFQLRVYGENTDIDIGTPEDLWGPGGTRLLPSGAGVVTLASSDANDTLAGTGAQTVRVNGLDTNFNRVSEVVNMDGTTDSDTVLLFTRVNFLELVTAGSNDDMVGTITATCGGNTQANMVPTHGRSLQALWTIADDIECEILSVWASVSETAGIVGIAELVIQEKPIDSGFWTTRYKTSVAIQKSIIHNFTVPIGVRPRCDLRMRITSVGANNVHVDGGFDMLLYDAHGGVAAGSL